MSDSGTSDATNGASGAELQLQEFCAELLECEPREITTDDNLLGLGGNSLMAMMLGNRIELAWGVRPSMEQLLTSTVCELAETRPAGS